MDLAHRFEQSQCDVFWLPPWAHAVDRPDLHVTHSKRPLETWNSVNRVRATHQTAAPLVAEVSDLHAHGVSRWMITDLADHPALYDPLEAHGYIPGHDHTLRVIRADASLPLPEGIDVRTVHDAATLEDAIRTAERGFGLPTSPLTPDRVTDELAACTGPDARVFRVVAYDRASGHPMAYGGLNTYPALGVGFLWGGSTVPEHRQRGAYRAVLAARMQRAHRLGCTHVGLYARHGTSDPIVAGLGFAAHGTMQTWHRQKKR